MKICHELEWIVLSVQNLKVLSLLSDVTKKNIDAFHTFEKLVPVNVCDICAWKMCETIIKMCADSFCVSKLIH